MKLARIAFVVFVVLLVGVSIAALKHVHKNRLTTDRQCQMYRAWIEWDKSPQASGMFGPVAAMELTCGDTWLARMNRKLEWEMPWR